MPDKVTLSESLPISPVDVTILLILSACAILILGCVFERFQYFRSARVNTTLFMKELATVLKTGKNAVALDYCRSGDGAVARIMRQAVLNMDRTRAEVHASLTTAIEMEKVAMERYLSVLATMSGVLPLVGGIGSFVIMIRILGQAAASGALDGPTVVAGFGRALVPVVFSLVLSVMATVAYNTFVRVIRRRVVRLEDAREAWFVIWTRYARHARPARSLPVSSVAQENAPSELLR